MDSGWIDILAEGCCRMAAAREQGGKAVFPLETTPLFSRTTFDRDQEIEVELFLTSTGHACTLCGVQQLLQGVQCSADAQGCKMRQSISRRQCLW